MTYSALSYPTTDTDEYANLALGDRDVYATRADRGIEIYDLDSHEEIGEIPPPEGTGSVDDVAFADGFLFALDAREPGFLSVLSVGDSGLPVIVGQPTPAPVGPFSGVSAGGGYVVVSGGTSSLTLYRYDHEGRLSPELARIDLGRGQPDVLLAPDGKRGFVSTHYYGPYFGLNIIEASKTGDSVRLRERGSVQLDTYGFTPGGAKPANFPIESAIVGPLLYLATGSGLVILSVADPDAPQILQVLDIGIAAVNIDAWGNTAAVVGSSPDPTLVLLDTTDPALPAVREMRRLPPDSRPMAVAVGTKDIVVALRSRGILIYPHTQWSTGPERISQ